MTYIVHCGKDMSSAPYMFAKFFASAGNDAGSKQRIINELLSYQPWHTRLERDAQGAWQLEFHSAEDWERFQERWTLS
jgi:hypothetical protein